jgi:transglycosylase-like protein
MAVLAPAAVGDPPAAAPSGPSDGGACEGQEAPPADPTVPPPDLRLPPGLRGGGPSCETPPQAPEPAGRSAAAPAEPPPPASASAVLAEIARCESGGDPRAVSGGGRYRGKYQFDRRTWRSVGGRGDPARAPEEEQDRRAAALLRARGTAPWPVCGRAVAAMARPSGPAAPR